MSPRPSELVQSAEIAAALSAFSRLGGRAKSKAKTTANRAKAQAYWDAVRAGKAQPPKRGTKKRARK